MTSPVVILTPMTQRTHPRTAAPDEQLAERVTRLEARQDAANETRAELISWVRIIVMVALGLFSIIATFLR